MCVRGAVRADIKIHPTFGKSTFGKTFSEARAKSIATVIQFDLGFCSTFGKSGYKSILLCIKYNNIDR
jgi:hypothetical protein